MSELLGGLSFPEKFHDVDRFLALGLFDSIDGGSLEFFGLAPERRRRR